MVQNIDTPMVQNIDTPTVLHGKPALNKLDVPHEMIQDLNDTEYHHPVVHVISYVNLTKVPSNGVYVIQIDELTEDMVVSYVYLNGVEVDIKVNTGVQINLVPKHML